MGAVAALPVELHLVDEPVGGALLDEVGLHEAAEDGVLPPGPVGEPTVALGRLDVAAADGDSHEVAEGAKPGGERGAGLDGSALRDPCQRGGDLAAGESDERVGAQDRRVVTVEGCRDGRHVRGTPWC